MAARSPLERPRERRLSGAAALGRLSALALVALTALVVWRATGPDADDDRPTAEATTTPAPAAPAPEAPQWLSDPDAWAFEPAAAVDADGILWVVWLAWREDGERGARVDLEYARLIEGELLGRGTLAADLRAPAAPHLVAWRAGVYGVVEAGAEGARSLHGFSLVLGPTEVEASELETVAPPGPARLEPQLASDGERELQVVWQELVGTSYDLHWARREGEGWSAERALVASELDEWRPRAVMAPDGALHVVYDVYREGSFDVDRLLARGGVVVERGTLAGGPDHQAWPAVALAPDGTLWVAWEAGARFGETGPLRGANGNVVRIAGLRDGDPGFVRGLPTPAPGERREQPRLCADRTGPTLTWRTMSIEPPPDVAPERRWMWNAGRSSLQLFDADGRLESRMLPGSDGDNASTEVLCPDGRGGVWIAFAGDLRSTRFAERPRWNDSLESRWRIGLWRAPASTGRPALAAAAPPSLRTGPAPTTERFKPEPDGAQPHLYFGDLHRHTHLSRCAGASDGTIVDAYRYARGPGALDFVAITDHCQHLTPFSWWRSVRDVVRYSAPGSLVTFTALEKLVGGEGHFNAIFPDLERDAQDLVPRLWHELEPDSRVVLIPHMMGGDTLNRFVWDAFDEEKMRVLEVYQGYRGSFEGPDLPYESQDRQFAEAALSVGLERGHHFGLIASSDHSSTGTSFAGVRADALERGSVHEALAARRTFASTTRADVDASLGLLRMGERGGSGAGPTPFRVRARAAAPVAYVDVIKNGRPFARRAGSGAAELFVLSLAPRGNVDPEPLELRASGGSIRAARTRLASSTGLQYEVGEDGVLRCRPVPRERAELVLEVTWDPGTERPRLVYTYEGVRRAIELDDLPPGGAIRLRPKRADAPPTASDGLWRLGAPLALDAVDLAFPDPQRKRGDSYYARIAWTDGNVAWTSPITVTGAERER